MDSYFLKHFINVRLITIMAALSIKEIKEKIFPYLNFKIKMK